MLNNNNNARKAAEAILLSLAMLALLKEAEMANNNSAMINASGISYSDEGAMLSNRKPSEDSSLSDYNGTIDSKENGSSMPLEEKDNYTQEEVDQLISEGTVMLYSYGNSPYYLCGIRVAKAEGDYTAPAGYDLYQELISINDGNGITYLRTSNYFTKKQDLRRVLNPEEI